MSCLVSLVKVSFTKSGPDGLVAMSCLVSLVNVSFTLKKSGPDGLVAMQLWLFNCTRTDQWWWLSMECDELTLSDGLGQRLLSLVDAS